MGIDQAETSQDVSRRRVFYIPGYDPIHPRRYRELYRKEGAAQAGISGYEIGLKPKRTGGLYGWHVESETAGQAVSADVEVLVWSDIVREQMQGGVLATYGQLLRTAWTYMSSGALMRLMRLITHQLQLYRDHYLYYTCYHGFCFVLRLICSYYVLLFAHLV